MLDHLPEIIAFASKATPLALLAVALLIIFQLTTGKKVSEMITGKKVSIPPEVMTDMLETLKKLGVQNTSLNTQNDTLLNNHFKHEIPEMLQSMKRIEEKVNFIKDDHGNRLTAIETFIDLTK